MQVKPIIVSCPNFGRAFTTEERHQYQQLISDTKKQLGIKDTTAIVFDFNVPSDKEYNTGIGTTFSDSMKQFTRFLNALAGVNSIQLEPQGKIKPDNISPYSGTNYAIGEHLIDLKKLTTPKYGFLLASRDVMAADYQYKGDIKKREFKTDYKYVIGDGKNDGRQHKLLYKAFANFNSAVKNNATYVQELNKEYTQFKQKNANWLEKNALYELLSKEYKSSDFRTWEEPDKSLYSKTTSDDVRQSRINELTKKHKNFIDFENFKQFIADKQQKESRIFLNDKDIKLYGDCLIGFSQGEMWADIDCFKDNLYYGGPDPNCPETNCIQPWGLPALDYSQLGECSEAGDISKLGETGKLLYNKYLNFFEKYDGIRVDAAWQFVTPFIYRSVNGNYEEVKFPEINDTIFNIMKTASLNSSHSSNLDNENIMLELVGISADKSREMTINKYPHLYTTAYAEYDECPAKFLQKGYKQGMFYVGTGCHDNDSLINISKDVQKRKLHSDGIKRNYGFDFNNLAYKSPEYTSQAEEEKVQEDFRNAKQAEIFTSAKQFFTLPDMFGMEERINVSGKVHPDNWTVRIPSNYEEFYYTQLSKGYGLNLPKALSNAMKMCGIRNKSLEDKCNEAAEILRSKGPMTEAEANIADKNGALNNKFEYLS